MQFDIRTLLVAVALATICCAGARLLLWRLHPTIAGLGYWAAAGVVGTLALLSIAARGVVPESLALALAQTLMPAGLILVWDGFRRFVGRKPLSPAVLSLLAAIVLIAILTSHVAQTLTVRSTINALLLAVLSFMIARELLTAALPGQLAMRVTGWLYAANAVFFLVRAVFAARTVEVVGPWNPDGLAALPLLWWLCMVVATTLGMVLMTGARLQEDLDRQAHRDPLTGALNRRAFALIAEKALSRARRDRQPLSVLMMDLDRFKQINDRLGHAVGDDILCRFVAVVERMLRVEDVLCRFGGEEFVALLPGTSAAQALAAGERLRIAYVDESAATQTAKQLPFAISVSIGIGELREDEDIDGLIRRADAALYEAKVRGRNRCELAGDTLGEIVDGAATV